MIIGRTRTLTQATIEDERDFLMACISYELKSPLANVEQEYYDSIAREESQGDEEVYRSILNSFLNTRDREEEIWKEIRHKHYEGIFVSIISYYERSLKMMIQKEPENNKVKDLWKQVKKECEEATNSDFSKMDVSQIHSIYTELRNYYVHHFLKPERLDNIKRYAKKSTYFEVSGEAIYIVDNRFLEKVLSDVYNILITFADAYVSHKS